MRTISTTEVSKATTSPETPLGTRRDTDRPAPRRTTRTPVPSAHAGRATATRSSRPWKRIIIDSTLLATFIFSFASLAIGNSLWHVAAGLTFTATAALHASLNWSWIRGVARKRRTIRKRTRRNVIVDSILAVGGAVIVGSGLAMWADVGHMVPFHMAGAILVSIATVVLHRRSIKRAVLGQAGR